MGWQEDFRQHFPIVADRHYANIAYTSPLAPVVSRAIGDFFDGITHARSDKPQWLRDADGCRAELAKLIHGNPRRIAFTKNTCEALNVVAQGLRWRAGDNMVTNDQEHPSNLLPWLNLRRQGVDVRIVRARERQLDLTAILSRIDARTRLVAVSWVQSTSGQRLDLDVLSAHCRKHGARLVVDGIQGLGLLQLDVARTPIDALAGGTHKGLLGPLGLGFLYLSEPLLDELEPAHLGPSAAISLDMEGDLSFALRDRLDARRLETGNLNYPAIAGARRALALIDEAGPARIESWVTALSQDFAARLRERGFDVITPDDALPSATTTVHAANAGALNARLQKENVIASVVEGSYLRFAFGAYNSREDIDAIEGTLAGAPH